MAEPEARVPQISDSRETYVRWTPIGALPESHVSEIETRSYWSLDEQVKAFDRSAGPSLMDKESTRLAEFFKSAGTISKVMEPKAFVNPVVLDYIVKNPKLKAFAEGKPGAL